MKALVWMAMILQVSNLVAQPPILANQITMISPTGAIYCVTITLLFIDFMRVDVDLIRVEFFILPSQILCDQVPSKCSSKS